MNQDRKNDINLDDARLSALYREHIGDADQPSAAADARIRALARAAVEARPVARTAARKSVLRSWLDASWFKPSLAFATLASLSVVIVALMPREDMSVEREMTTPAPAAPAPAATAAREQEAASKMELPAAGRESAAATAESPAKQELPAAKPEPAPTAIAPIRPEAPAPQPLEADRARKARIDAAPAPKPQAQMRQKESFTPPPPKATVVEPAPAAPAAPAGSMAAGNVERRANPFPAHSADTAESARRSDAGPHASLSAPAASAAPAPAPAPPPPALAAQPQVAASAQRMEKPSNLSEPADARPGSGQPLPEARDSAQAPSYPNEPRSSIPLPYSYSSGRPPSRDAKLASPAAGSLAGLARQNTPQQPAAGLRKDEPVAKRMEAAPSMAAAPASSAAHRDPAEWIKAIMKLRAEGKTEQVTKELAEFQKMYPAYRLPDELKPLAAANK